MAFECESFLLSNTQTVDESGDKNTAKAHCGSLAGL
jgi:hypothetical protein